MTKTVLVENESGAIVSYEDTVEERRCRITAWAERAAADLDINPRQAALLRTIREVRVGGTHG